MSSNERLPVEDAEEVTRVYRVLLDRVGLENARRLGLKVNERRSPTGDELKVALAGRGVIRIELDETSGQSSDGFGAT